MSIRQIKMLTYSLLYLYAVNVGVPIRVRTSPQDWYTRYYIKQYMI